MHRPTLLSSRTKSPPCWTRPDPTVHCTIVQWTVGSGRVQHGGDFVLDESSVGLCIGPAPQGTVIVAATQSKVSGL